MKTSKTAFETLRFTVEDFTALQLALHDRITSLGSYYDQEYAKKEIQRARDLIKKLEHFLPAPEGIESESTIPTLPTRGIIRDDDPVPEEEL